jgi:thioredoxin 1
MPNRRIATLALAAIAALGALSSPSARALTFQPYTPAALNAAQAAGKPVVLHFHADWCPTCRAQTKVMDTFKTDPALDKVTLMVVDYDTTKELRKSLNVRGQSTLVVYKGKTEVTRSVGETDAAKLREVLLKSL